MMTDADFDRELERRVQAATSNGETLKVTLTKDEIKEFAQRKFFWNYAGDDIYAELLEVILAADRPDEAARGRSRKAHPDLVL